MYEYIALYGGKKIQVQASTSYEAQLTAFSYFQKASRKKLRPYDIIVALAEKNGEQVTHSTADF